MSILSKIKNIVNKDSRFLYFSNKGFYKKMDDKEFVEKKYKILFNREINWDNLQYYTEKLQWLKLNDRNDKYTKIVDKYEVRDYVKNKIGEEYLIPLIGCWESPDEIDFDKLPNKFVLKCNHNSGLGMCVCTDKTKLNKKKVIADLKKGLKENYYYAQREWPYKNVKPRVICEAYIGDGKAAPDDYKFILIGGEIYQVLVCKFRETGNTKFFYFDKDWNRVYCQYDEPKEHIVIEKPKNYELMLELALTLNEDLKTSRIDLYNVDGKIYFGEITYYDSAGFDVDITPEEDLKRGLKLKL